MIFLLNIAGAAALLIWSVRLVRTGVERAFANELRLWLRRSAQNRILAAGTGMLSAIFLQSSTAVAMLVSNFVAKGGLTTAVGLEILLGADVGSAVVSQLLLLKQPFMVPALLLAGVILFQRGSKSTTRQLGRILVGLGLIFVSLDMIRAATLPLVESNGTHVVLQYLGSEPFTAFAIGAVFAWVVHSSVAAVLLIVTLASQGILPLAGAAAMVLGANLGGSFIAFVLTLAAPLTARHMVLGNMILRGGGAILVLLGMQFMPELLDYLGATPARQVINLHLAFNAVLALLALPVAGLAGRLAAFILPEPNAGAEALHAVTALDSAMLETPARALDCASRELLRMGQMIEAMFRTIMPLYDDWDDVSAEAVKVQDRLVKDTNLNIKLYLAKVSKAAQDEETSKRALDLAGVSGHLHAASDVLSRNVLKLARRLELEGVNFSENGKQEIADFSDRVLHNMQLALNVIMTQNPDAARELVAAKDIVRAVEQKLQRSHLERLREGLVESIETSNIHQETLRALKQINTSFSMAGYPILSRTGDLLDSRLSEH